jgi:hypothetical protein
MRILFINNQVDNRGTGNALYDYAHYNEEILGNESAVMTLDNAPPNGLMLDRLNKRFGKVYNPYDAISDREFIESIDYIYHIKSGENDGGMQVAGIPLGIHAVFHPTQPHGDRYATISRWMGEKFGVPFVPHIVNKRFSLSWGEFTEYRALCGIPPTAIVFGRHGGPDTFDIPWVWSAMVEAAREDPNIYFLFMGTNPPEKPVNDHFVFLPESSDAYEKYMFINACDAMIHARMRGETYGISVGEFAVQGKPVFTYGDSPEQAHIQMLDNMAVIYSNGADLIGKLCNFSLCGNTIKENKSEYLQHTPENVMQIFKEVFLME